MPILPEIEEEPTRAERITGTVRDAISRLAGSDARVTVRLVALLTLAVVGSSMAPIPWAQVAVLSIVGIALDVARKR